MRILLTGGTGLIGRALCQHWSGQGHALWVLSRQPQQVAALCSGARGIARLQDLDAGTPLDAVVNLAGAPIADRRWSAARRQQLWHSRVDLTRALVDWIGGQARPPRVLLSGSAVGWYGDCGDQWLNESSPAGPDDFGALLCRQWELEAARARQHGLRVVHVRTAPVLAPQGGMLERLRRPFSLGLGARLGSGQQWMPWIHLDDQVGLMDFALQHGDCEGPLNACAPGLVRNGEFTRALASALHRPALLAAPAAVLRLALGEMAVLLLGGQRLQPRRAQQAGYVFRHPEIHSALRQLLDRSP